MVLSGAANLDTPAFRGRDCKYCIPYNLGELLAADLPLLAKLPGMTHAP